MNWVRMRYLDASALVKLVVDEGDHAHVRLFFHSTTNFAATSTGLASVEVLAKKHSLDLSDALQLETILRGKYGHLGPNSASVLVTADRKLAKAAEIEGVRAWNCAAAAAPDWA